MEKAGMKIGQEVWYSDTYGNVQSGETIRFYEENPDYVKVKGTRDSYVTGGVKIKDCYDTKDELLAAMQKNHEEKVVSFCKEIKTVHDLVRFMYDNTVSCAEEYTDWDARKAAYIRAKELLGMDLETKGGTE